MKRHSRPFPIRLLLDAQSVRWCCYADDADLRIHVVAESSSVAIALAARHFRCPEQRIICRYAMTLLSIDADQRRYRWPAFIPAAAVVHAGNSSNGF
jgi:hypothetical protein